MLTAESPVNVLIVDDHPLFRRGVCQLLELAPGFCVVGEAASGEEGLQLAQTLDPDLILLDLNMKGMDGLTTLRALRDADVTARIVILTVSNNPEDTLAAIRAGADGYILKDTDPDDMLRMIDNTMKGMEAFSPQMMSLLTHALRKEASSESRSLALLTERELAILKGLVAGKSNRVIGRELDIMESTVKVHIRNVLKKLKFRSRVEAAVWAVSQHLDG